MTDTRIFPFFRPGPLMRAALMALLIPGPVALAQESVEDPWEPLNQHIFAFNQLFDDWFMQPLAKGYDEVVPPPAKKGVSNFFSNLNDVNVLLNNLLQGKATEAASDGGRIVLNTVFGVAGLWDMAQHVGLEKHNEDFGQTLGYWGVGPGPYFVMPFVGPSTVRDTLGFGVDMAVTPVSSPDDPGTRNTLHALRLVDARVDALQLDRMMYGDPYIFMREAYLQQRAYDVRDGQGMDSSTPGGDPWSDWD